MCQLCGCAHYLNQGAPTLLKRATELVEQLGLTPQNVDLFEECEAISGLIAPRMSPTTEEEVWQTVSWVHQLHLGRYQEKYRAYAAAARDIFAHLPTPGHPQEVITAYHQLEQLCHSLEEGDIAAISEPATRETLLAVKHVHDDLPAKWAGIIERYRLEAP
ncbi:MAG: hypothetical protein HYU86_00505 [Chloroflexi bacterium]|nr:hypothetical protein [Chloroflexota bacterium]